MKLLDYIFKFLKKGYMDKLQLRQECAPLMSANTISDNLKLIDIFLEYFFLIINEHQKDTLKTQVEADARMMFQMIFSKALNLKKILEGVEYESNGIKLNKIVDPTIVASLIRNLYETVCVFELVYIIHDSDEERNLLYNLWVISGLKYRQKFSSSVQTPEGKAKIDEEEKLIQSFIKEIEDSAIYKRMTPDNQNKINQKIKDKDYKIHVVKDNVRFLNWQEVSELYTGANKDLFENVYNYFSLYSHPSNVAVFQFNDMFGQSSAFKDLTTFNMKYCFSLFSIFVADYMKVFPNVKSTYSKQSIKSQILLNSHNKMIRGESYSISDAWKNLE